MFGLFNRTKRPRGTVYLTTRQTTPMQLDALPPSDTPESEAVIRRRSNATETVTGLFQPLNRKFFRVKPTTNFEN